MPRRSELTCALSGKNALDFEDEDKEDEEDEDEDDNEEEKEKGKESKISQYFFY